MRDDDIAGVGMGAIMPGGGSVDQFFSNLLRKRCFVREIPEWLWKRDIFFSSHRDAPNASYSTLAALAEDLPGDLAELKIPPQCHD